MTEPFLKRRGPAVAGSIPDVLDMFASEVRFYREIAPVVGVRVPKCLKAEADGGGTLLVLENLSDWHLGADPAQTAQLLAGMHRRWEGGAAERWPWLRRAGAASDLVADLFDETWPTVASRPESTPALRALGERLCGCVPAVELTAANAGRETLVHGDASMQNLRTSAAGEIALLDWEDVGTAPGVTDLAWLLVSSVEPLRWDETIAAYGAADGLSDALPAATSQAILSLAHTPPGSELATDWVRRIEEASGRLA